MESTAGGLVGGYTPNYATVEQIKAFRVEIDALIEKAKILEIQSQDYKLGRLAKDKTYEHLIEAKMWLGKCLEAIGNPFPAELADKAK